MDEQQKDLKEYLARIRSTIAKSNSLVTQAELRIAETDRMLERQGLTREQVLAMRFSDAQIEAANAELKRRGMDPIERWEGKVARDAEGGTGDEGGQEYVVGSGGGEELENRQRKFGMMMKPFQI